jgi:hypothetical protein
MNNDLPNSLRAMSRLRMRLDTDYLLRLRWMYEMRSGDYDHAPATAALNAAGARAVQAELRRRGIHS